MVITQTHRSLIEKTRSVGAAREAEDLSDVDCVFIVANIVRDLGLFAQFPELPKAFPNFFEAGFSERPDIGKYDFLALFERLVSLRPDADSFFACLGTLYKARLKYANILRLQPIPTMDQVGPRGLLQFGSFSAPSLTAFLLWRKWIYDIDNRAAQETGYLFEPIIAKAIGGTPVSAKHSPIRRALNAAKGRQVDCLKNKKAYEFKIRVTIAASGQGRWGEELDFPLDCQTSGYIPVLVVLDPTPNPKLADLERAYKKHVGEVYVGDAAWQHLESEAGPTMATFLELYVRRPINELLKSLPASLPDITLGMADSNFNVRIGDEIFTIQRTPLPSSDVESEIPEDVEEQMPGV